MASRKLRVYGLNVHALDGTGDYGQHYAIVATTSKTAAARALGASRYEFDAMAHETGNEVECRLALAWPGQVFVQAGDCSQRPEAQNFHPARLERGGLKALIAS